MIRTALLALLAFAGFAAERQPLTLDATNRPNNMATTDTLRVRSTGGVTTEQAATQDRIGLLGRAGGTGTHAVTLTPATLTDSRTVTFPDAAGVAVLDTATQTLTNKSLTAPTITGTWTAVGATVTDLGTVTTVDINGGTIDGTTQASGTINGPIAAGGTWTAAATWTLPAFTLGGPVTLNGQSFSGAASFSSTLTVAGGVTINSTGPQVIDASAGTTGAKYARILNDGAQLFFGVESSSAGGFFTGSAAYDSCVWTQGRLFLRGGTGVAVAGAVTCSSTLTVTNAIQTDTDSTAGNTRFFIYDVDNGTLERVSVGAADSGGAGFKVLRIPN